MNWMSTILLKLSFVIVLIGTATCLAARSYGERLPPNDSLNGFKDGCQNITDLCWYGVTINQTPVVDAEKKLEGHSYILISTTTKPNTQTNSNTLPCGAYFIYEYATVNGLVLRCRGLRLGDWINHFGVPDGIGQQHDVLFYNGKTKMRLQINGALTPDTPIIEFALYIPRAFSEYQYDWQGFAPRWRYCQLNTFNPCT
jgi:hypothetical protein